MERIKCATFDKEMQDSIPQDIKDKMKADRNKAEEEMNIKEEFEKCKSNPYYFMTNYVIVNGKYELIVESEDGGDIEFFIEGLNNKIGTYEFKDFEITNLDFTTTLVNLNPGVVNTGGGNSGGGSSGGGSNGGSSSVTKEIINLNEKSLNEEEVEINLKSNENHAPTSSGITGAVIGFAKSGIFRNETLVNNS